MDKDKRLESHGQSSWLEMQQFIGDLLTSGGPQHHQDAFHLAWGVAGGVAGPGADALGLKGAGLAPLAQSRAQDRVPPVPQHQDRVPPVPQHQDRVPPVPQHQDRVPPVPQHQDKTDPAAHHRQTQADRTGQMRDRRGGGDTSAEHHGCTCPGCPFSSPPPVFETLKPRQPPAPLPPLSSSSSSSSRLPKPLGGSSSSSSAPQGLCLPVQDPSEPCSSTTAQDGDPRGAGDPRGDGDPLSPGQASDQTSSEGSGSRGSPPPHPHHHPHHHLPMFPCLCSLQTCAQLLGQQEGADSSHGRHHFHPCAFAACLPCPQLSARHRHHHHHPPHGGSRAHPPQAAFPCYAFATCAHLCRQQHGGEQQQRAQGAGGGRGTSSSSLPHPCMHCPASFARPSQLLHHQRSEHANKQGGFICTECGRSFNSHSNLRIHLNVHTGARPYACADCGKGFSQSGALKIHRRIHTGERPYSCNYCGRGFPHLAGVRAHQRTHTGEKPYHCTQCGKCFTQSGALKIHVRIHTGERPFLCSLCGKAFSNRSGIRFHYRAVHGILPEPPAAAASSGVTGGLYRGPAPGRPRGSTSSSSSTRGAAGGDTSQNAAAGSSRAPADDNKPRPGAGLPYACEDCGLCFKDAPSRNRHQALTHYSEGAGEGETAPEDRLNAKGVD